MRYTCRTLLAVLAAAIVVAISTAAAQELPEVAAVDKAPTVDGLLTDAAWKEALPLALDGYCDGARREKGEAPESATRAFVVTDQDALYVAFRCEEPHPDGPWVYENEKYRRRRNAHVMAGDYVALAIDMGRFGFYNYYMFFVNPAGDLYKCFTWPHRYDLVLRDVEL
ncbi:MAG: hypothetical protein R6V58_08645, partial [Planctomycetota bacterium]